MKKGFALFTLLAFLSMGTFTVFAQDETNTGNVEQASEDVSETTPEDNQSSEKKKKRDIKKKILYMFLQNLVKQFQKRKVKNTKISYLIYQNF